MAYILDADWIINALAGRNQAVSTLNLIAGDRICVSWITVGEVYERAYDFPNPQPHLESFRLFLSPYVVLNLNAPIMERFAEVRSHLRHRGSIIPDFDIIVAATALHYDLTVLTFDVEHFGRVPDLRVYRPRQSGNS